VTAERDIEQAVVRVRERVARVEEDRSLARERA